MTSSYNFATASKRESPYGKGCGAAIAAVTLKENPMKFRLNVVAGIVAVVTQTVILVGCEEDLTPQKTVWSSALTEHTTAIEGFKTKNKAALAQLDKLVAKPDGAAAASKSKLIELLKAQGADISGLEASLTKSKEAVAKAEASGKLMEMTSAVEAADKDWKAAYEKTAGSMTMSTTQIAALEKQISEEAKAVVAAIDPAKLAKEGGMIDFSDIDFKVGSAEFDFTKPASKGALTTLTTLAKACPELKLEFIGHTDKTGDAKKNEKLSEERANAVKAYIVKEGVKAPVVTKTSGVGGKEPLAAEPDAGSADEKAMDKAVLDANRSRNRRISVKVIEHCK
jgi:outer membrane protein OmpA-like peptidoglycan-associated protein